MAKQCGELLTTFCDSAGGDRGGVSDLIVSIKASKLPIVCICNDKYKTSLRSLKNHCLEINWSKPTKPQAAVRLRQIAHAEGLQMNQACASPNI